MQDCMNSNIFWALKQDILKIFRRKVKRVRACAANSDRTAVSIGENLVVALRFAAEFHPEGPGGGCK